MKVRLLFIFRFQKNPQSNAEDDIFLEDQSINQFIVGGDYSVEMKFKQPDNISSLEGEPQAQYLYSQVREAYRYFNHLQQARMDEYINSIWERKKK